MSAGGHLDHLHDQHHKPARGRGPDLQQLVGTTGTDRQPVRRLPQDHQQSITNVAEAGAGVQADLPAGAEAEGAGAEGIPRLDPAHLISRSAAAAETGAAKAKAGTAAAEAQTGVAGAGAGAVVGTGTVLHLGMAVVATGHLVLSGTGMAGWPHQCAAMEGMETGMTGTHHQEADMVAAGEQPDCSADVNHIVQASCNTSGSELAYLCACWQLLLVPYI